MADQPRRIQLRRTKGWRVPENTVVVTRPGKWGNPFIVNPYVTPGSRSGAAYICVPTLEDAIECFRLMVTDNEVRMASLRELRGKNLACWCSLCRRHREGKPFGEACPNCTPCHADILGQLACEAIDA